MDTNNEELPLLIPEKLDATPNDALKEEPTSTPEKLDVCPITDICSARSMIRIGPTVLFAMDRILCVIIDKTQGSGYTFRISVPYNA